MENQRDSINGNGAQRILITGGSGLIGSRLTDLLLARGFSVAHLSRRQGHYGKAQSFSWDPEKGLIDPAALEGIDCIIHLAGANIGEKRWSNTRKKGIINSRVKSAELLLKACADTNRWPKTFISASATGYYGSVSSERIFTENDEPADDFLGNTCRLWEEAAKKFAERGVRTLMIRTAVVLDKQDSALSRLTLPARFGLVTRLGTGRQYFPWIHISDLCNIYLKAVSDNQPSGAYNAVAPQHVTHDEFIAVMAEVMKRPVFLPHVPAWVLKLVLGDLSDVVVKGSRVSSEKITASGFDFLFPDLHDALEDVLGS